MKLLTSIFISTILLLNLSGCDNTNENSISSDDKILQDAYANKHSGLQVHDAGKVTKLLSDDTTGSRHQRFILELDSGQTLLIAHNIDISIRIDTLSLGDTVEFYGEYVWNTKGGMVHWTHHDPEKKHPDGWLKHQNIKYD